MIIYKVRITFTDPVLGTASNNPDIHREFIASKSADADLIKQEMANLPAEILEDKMLTVFPRKDGTPIVYDYQIKGFFKESLAPYVEFGNLEVGSTKISKWTHKRIVAQHLFIAPREILIHMPRGTSVTNCVRTLRADTPRGERTALMTSEQVPEGSVIEFEVKIFSDILAPLVEELLEYGELKGLGQWRNAGKGRFITEILEVEKVRPKRTFATKGKEVKAKAKALKSVKSA